MRELLKQTIPASGMPPDEIPISDRTAGKQIMALDEVRRILSRKGIRTLAVNDRYKLTLKSAGRGAASRLDRYRPELVVYTVHGRPVATIRMTARSEAYIVDTAGGEERPGERSSISLPQEAAELVLGLVATLS